MANKNQPRVIGLLLALMLTINTFSAVSYVSTVSELVSGVSSVSAGDTIYLRDGIYENFFLDITNSGTPENYITIAAENGGEAKFRGTVEIIFNGNYIKFSGFDMEGVTVPLSTRLIVVNGHHNIIEDIFLRDFNNGSNDHHQLVYLYRTAHDNQINRCWFEKGKVKGVVIFSDYKAGFTTGNNTIQNCFFKALRQDGNGGSAIRLGGTDNNPYPDGSSKVLNNLFDEYDGEGEIISQKSRYNLIDGNTFLNCHGSVTCRHYHYNTVSNNYFLTTKDRPYGGCVVIWSEKHQILNNYFSNTKSRFPDGGAIWFVAGTDTIEYENNHEQVNDVLIKDNIVYNPSESNYAIAFGYKYGVGRDIMPKNVTFEGNYVYREGSKKLVHYQAPCENIVYESDNKFYSNADDSPLTETNPNLQLEVLNGYDVYRADGKGPNTNPLQRTDVGPLWRKYIVEDDEVPTKPGPLSAQVLSDSTYRLSWPSSTDNIGISAYRVYRNGSFKETVTDTFAIISNLFCSNVYSYEVRAVDLNRNYSEASDPVEITTDSCEVIVNSISESTNTGALVYPNPFESNITVQRNNLEKIDQMNFFDAKGAIIPISTNYTEHQEQITITVPANLLGGIYVLQLISNNTVTSFRLIK